MSAATGRSEPGTAARIGLALAVLFLPGCLSRGSSPNRVSDGPPPTTPILLADASPPQILTPIEETEAWTAIEDLDDPRFPVYTRAAARLIAYGEAALPYLVAAGRRDRVDFGVPSSATAPVIHRILDRMTSERLVAYLRSPYEALRNSAVRHLGDRKEVGAVPHLLESLPTTPPAIRTKVCLSLQAITQIPVERPESWEDQLPELLPAWQEWWRARQPGAPVVQPTF